VPTKFVVARVRRHNKHKGTQLSLTGSPASTSPYAAAAAVASLVVDFNLILYCRAMILSPSGDYDAQLQSVNGDDRMLLC